MTKAFSIAALAMTFALASSTMMRAQDKPPASAAPRALSAGTALRIQVVISRYQGEKKISSLPYSMSVSSAHIGDPNREPAGRANIRMGTKIPITMVAAPTVDGKPIPGVPTAGPIQYQDVGTNIDCLVWALEDGRFRLELTIEDSSVYPDDKETAGAAKGSPSFRSFRASDSMLLKDGATSQFTTATDKVTGEIVKVDVTLTVVK